MTRRTRRILFYMLVALFPVISIGVVLYAEGWRLSIQPWKFEKVGAILVRPYPADAAITLDNQPITDRAGLLSQNILISDLLPGNYELGLTRNGYRPWHETATVLPSLVTEFHAAVLIPKKPASRSTTTIAHFYIASDELVMQSPNGTIAWRGKTIGNGTIVSVTNNLGALMFQNRGGIYARYDFSAATTTKLFSLTNDDVSLDAYDPAIMVIRNSGSVWVRNTTAATTTLVDRVSSPTIIGEPIASFTAALAWTHVAPKNIGEGVSSSIVAYDPLSQTVTTSSITIAGRTAALAWIDNNRLGVLQDDGSLFIYSAEAEDFQKIADDVKNFSVAPDASAIAAVEHSGFEIIPLDDSQTYHRFNIPDVGSITQAIWYRDANHLFLASPASVAFLDLQDLGLHNLQTVAEGTNPLYNPSKNILYLINSAGNLEQFDFPS